MASNMRSLFSDPEYYVKAFHRYAEISKKFDVYASWGDRVFGEKIVPKFRVTIGEKEQFRVLGIGSGSGEMDVKMLTKLLQHFPHINNRVVEPAEDQITMYKALLQDKAHELHGVNSDWQQQTIDQYQKAGDLTKFHFVHAVQCLCYAEDPDRSLMYLYNLVEPGGVLLATINSDKCQHAQFWGYLPNLKDKHYHQITTANFRESLEKRGIPYEEYAQPSNIDVTKCFDSSSEDGALMLSMITATIKFRETASAEVQTEVMQRLTECSERRENKVFMSNNWDAIVVSKPMN